MLQLLLVYLPLFGSSVLKPDLHLKHTGDAHKHEIEASETHLVEKDSYWMLLNMIRNIKGWCIISSDAFPLTYLLGLYRRVCYLERMLNCNDFAFFGVHFIVPCPAYFCFRLVISFFPRITLLHCGFNKQNEEAEKKPPPITIMRTRGRVSPLTLLMRGVCLAIEDYGFQRFLLVDCWGAFCAVLISTIGDKMCPLNHDGEENTAPSS